MVPHPYAPQSIELPGYVPNFLSGFQIVLIYGAACILLCIIVGKIFNVQGVEMLLMYWLSITGVTHVVLESYYVLTPKFYTVDYPMYLAEVWKEYGKADSRYVWRDPTVVAIEIVLSFVNGSASLLAMYAITTKKPYKHPLIVLISLVDIFMFAIYFGTPWLGGNVSHASSPYYFWVYYVTLNSLYGVWVPALIGTRSWMKIVQAMGTNIKEE